MKPLLLGLAVIVLGLSADSAMAQVPWYRPPGYVQHGPYGFTYTPPAYGLGFYGGGYSPVEGYQRGLADVIRARGQAAENISRARINNEEAREQYIENKLRWTETYLERKRIGEAERARQHAEDRERRQSYLASRRDSAPETLPPSMFDPESGAIQWPEPLQAEIYAEYRRQIEQELEIQATSGTMANSNKVRNLARQMQSLLKEKFR